MEHVPLGDKLQLVLAGVMGPMEVKVTVPVGVVAPEVAVLVTVAVHVEAWFTIIGVEQLIVVEVACIPGVNVVIPLLGL